MSDNPMDSAFETADESSNEDERSQASGFNADEWYEELDGDAPKTKTVGVSTNEVMHAFYRELKSADDVDVDPAVSIRDHLSNLARRHDQVFERAMRKLEIERETRD